MATRQISTQFWTSESLRGISAPTRLFLMYTLSGPASNMAGLFRLSWDDCMEDTGLTRGQVEEGLREGEARDFLRYDPERRLVWVINRIRYEFPAGKLSPTQRMTIRRIIVAAPPSKLRIEFCMEYQALGDPFDSLLDTLLHVVPDRVSPGVSDTPGEKREESREQREERGEPEEEGGGEGEPRAPRAALNGFDAFWARYPNREGKGKAEESWQKHVVRRKVQTEAVLAGIANWEGSQKWADGFIPLPATWLNQHRWEDDPRPVSPLSVAGRRSVAAGQRLLDRVARKLDEKPGKPRDGPDAQRPLDLEDRKPDEEKPP